MSRPRSRPESIAALMALVTASLALIAPPAPLTVSEWADRYAVLPKEGSSEPGPWKTSRAPYQRELMDVVHEPGIESVAKMIASQSGKTATDYNILWYFCRHDPSNILFVMPTEKQAEDVSREKLAPAIRDTPVLAEIFGSSKTREKSGNNLLNKSFPGGNLALAGANAPRGLAGRNRRIVYGDEIDGYPASSGAEGDPITLMEARTTNYWNRLKLYSSTPTIKDASRIEKLYSQSDMRKYFMPCPQCGHLQTLEFENLHWSGKGVAGARQVAEACYFVCTGSGCVIAEADKPAMVRAGRWIKTKPDPVDPKMAGFQMSVFPSPWKKWGEVVTDFLKCDGKPPLLKVFYNTRLGRTYELTGETVDDQQLLKRRVVYPARVPADVLVLTCGVDVQGNRLEYEIVGWGLDEKSWSIEYGILRGDPTQPALWAELKTILTARYRHASGTALSVACTYIDSGFHTKKVYDFVRPLQVRRIFASKGISGVGVPLNKPRPQARVHRGRVDLRLVGIDTAKESLYGNLKAEEGTGYCAFPSGYKDENGELQKFEFYDKEYFEQLTGEQLITEMDGMTPVRKWVKKRERNEALDCRVYAMAALEDLNVPWKKLAGNMGRKLRAAQEEFEQPAEESAEPARPTAAPELREKTRKKKPKRFKLPGYNFTHG